mmetsp:Transcript_139896/g.447432  ORF Transcript_139896/g.447432 Transcript_139896/m.447432 type:complete len:208 (+) Transcript_139896:423-1046(+)
MSRGGNGTRNTRGVTPSAQCAPSSRRAGSDEGTEKGHRVRPERRHPPHRRQRASARGQHRRRGRGRGRRGAHPSVHRRRHPSSNKGPRSPRRRDRRSVPAARGRQRRGASCGGRPANLALARRGRGREGATASGHREFSGRADIRCWRRRREQNRWCSHRYRHPMRTVASGMPTSTAKAAATRIAATAALACTAQPRSIPDCSEHVA